MAFSDFVESVTETPICRELKQGLDKVHEFYTKDPEKCVLYLKPPRGSAKSDLLILLPLLLEMYRWNELAERVKEPDPCDFCSTIYPDADTTDIVFRRGKYSGVRVESFITIDDEGKYHVNIDPGDPYELGYLVDIKFCPYCGRKLTESEDEE